MTDSGKLFQDSKYLLFVFRKSISLNYNDIYGWLALNYVSWFYNLDVFLKLKVTLVSLFVNILKTTLISPLERLHFSVGNFNCRSLSLYAKYLTVKTDLVALICNFSRSFIRFCLCGFHTELAYSKWHLTKLLYSVTNASVVYCELWSTFHKRVSTRLR